MDMTAQQIVSAYESCDLAPEVLAEQFQMETTSIKACLMQYSQIYRDNISGKKLDKLAPDYGNAVFKQESNKEDITDSEFELIKQATKDLALQSDNDEIKARMLKFLWNEKKGRNDTKKVANLNININVLNDTIVRAKEAKERSKELAAERSKQIQDAVVIKETVDI